jgi:hypothetical protein
MFLEKRIVCLIDLVKNEIIFSFFVGGGGGEKLQFLLEFKENTLFF